jgi:hypothetical protein
VSPIKTNTRSWIFLAAAAFILAVELLGLGPITHLWRRPSRAEFDALIAEGDSIVRALDTYEATHRQYPSNLPRSLDTSRGAKYGGWRYGCANACAHFELSVGDYSENSFRIDWQFDRRTWYIDG